MTFSWIMDVKEGLRSALATTERGVALTILTFIFFAFMFAIPVLSVPGNTIQIQAEVYTFAEYATIAVLAFLSALSVLLQWIAFRRNANSRSSVAGAATLGISGIIGSIISSIFASASCLTCVGALLSFLGFQGIIFLVEHRFAILGAALVLIVLSIILASRKIRRGCEVCTVPRT